jgi:hypothetical protein
MNNEPYVLAHVMDKTRELTGLYLNLLANTDLYQSFEMNGKPVNSVFWIMAHLPVTQNFLMLRSTGAEHVKIPWARQFGLGSVPVAKEECPPLDEVKDVMKKVHDLSLAHVRQIDPEQLELPNTSGFEFMGVKSIRDVIIHAIRHEGTHAGHLGWLCKCYGIKTV